MTPIQYRRHTPEIVLAAIRAHKARFGGCAPSVQDIMAETGIRSSGHVKMLLQELHNDGVIIVHPRIARMIEIVGETWTPPQQEATQ